VLLRPDVTSRHSPKYRQIVASIRTVGLVEAPVVYPIANTETFRLLDGHLRIQALKELKRTEVACLIATEDDSYTYNRQISRLSPVQDQKMIAAALAQGVPLATLAMALDITPGSLLRRKTLLDGICDEVRALLADKLISREIFGILSRLKPLRQIEACELMDGQDNYSPTFARSILAATPQDQLLHPRTKPLSLGSIEKMSQLEKELASLQDRMRSVEDSYGPDVLRFTVIKRFVADLISKPAVLGVMQRRYPDLLREFERMGKVDSLPETQRLT
jgi:hypothetical protein